ncbi:hypothetical protein MP228_004218 [Amoeboaphelidium protococcarum]|nr:hypothetical protein MP228_004218 [Amoeboaphelidium protococcarum]
MRHINQEAMKQINILRQQAITSNSDDTNKNELVQIIRVYAAKGDDNTQNLHVITRNPASQEDAQSFLIRICEVINGQLISVNSHADNNQKQTQSRSDELQNKVDIAELIRQQMAAEDVDASSGRICYDQQDLASIERIRQISQLLKFDHSIPLNERVLFAMKVEDFIRQYEDIFGQIASGMDLADNMNGLKVVDSLSSQSVDDQDKIDDALENVVDIDLTFNQFVNMIQLMQDNDDDDLHE